MEMNTLNDTHINRFTKYYAMQLPRLDIENRIKVFNFNMDIERKEGIK